MKSRRKLLLTLTVLFIGIVLSACGNDEKDIEGYWSNVGEDNIISFIFKDNYITGSIQPISTEPPIKDSVSYSGEYKKGKEKGEFQYKLKEDKVGLENGKTIFKSEDELNEMSGTVKLLDDEHIKIGDKIFIKDKSVDIHEYDKKE
ncbi:hypothetical protein OJ937_RS11535 [Staphylococcus pseudintermedius]|nr:hypothetical protein [Staphylococcus pseudintermedius]